MIHEKLEEAKRLYETANADQRYVLESLFPELRKSEDEIMRKNIKIALMSMEDNLSDFYSTHHTSQKELLAWLEKQGEHKLVDNVEPKFHEGDLIVDNCGYVWKIEGILNRFYILEGIEGGKSRPTIEWVNKTFHLWSIQDAKDGDVLVTENKNIFIFKSINDCTVYDYCGLYHGGFMGFSAAVNGSTATQLPTDYVPATKEQRDTLFEKMRESGYEWDAEKKEPKKIEDEPENYKQQLMSEMADLVKDYIRQKPTWSEEDNPYYDDICEILINLLHSKTADVNKDAIQKDLDWLNSFKDRIQPQPQSKQGWSEEDENRLKTIFDSLNTYAKMAHPCLKSVVEEEINWLKSLKPQKQWKPSEKQIDAIHYVVQH